MLAGLQAENEMIFGKHPKQVRAWFLLGKPVLRARRDFLRVAENLRWVRGVRADSHGLLKANP